MRSEWEDKVVDAYHRKYGYRYMSQNDEEKFITNHFKNFTGTFLDIGANDGMMVSNTFRLAELGWKGCCIEPSPVSYDRLVKNYAGNEKIACLKFAVMPTSGKIKFYDSNGDGISTTSLKQVEEWSRNPNVHYKEIEVTALSVEELFNLVGYEFNFISLDIEGMNFEVFKLIPFAKLTKLQMIVVEHAGRIDDMTAVIERYGFKEIRQARNPENIIFVKK